MAAFWTEPYQKHFQKYFQKPFDIQVFHDRDGFSLKLAIHDWAARHYRVYASMGLADKLIQNDEEDFGEVILFANVPDPDVPQLFINALFFILHQDIPLGTRFAIGGIEAMRPAFARRYGKSALYFTLAPSREEAEDATKAPTSEEMPEAFNRVRNHDEFGRVYQAYFITPEEDRYLEEYGPDEFEKAWKEQEGDPRSLRRPAFVEWKDGPRLKKRQDTPSKQPPPLPTDIMKDDRRS